MTSPPLLRTELEIARTDLANAMRRVDRLKSDLTRAQAAVEKLRAKVRELEHAGSP
jgi:multidrug resistance efflux pump